MNGAFLASDVDGVLIDSIAEHIAVTNSLLGLLGDETPVTDRVDEHRRFSMAAFTSSFGPDIADSLLTARAALMAARIDASPLFTDMVTALTTLNLPVILITAGYAEAVRRRLGPFAVGFTEILGCESGGKTELLQRHARGAMGYLTDTVRDVQRCAAVGIPTIGVTWGFDSAAALREAGCSRVITDPQQIHAITEERTN